MVGNRCDKRWVEPTTVLVRTFQIEVSWIFEFWTVYYNSIPWRTGVEPYVHDICFFLEFAIWWTWMGKSFWQEVFSITFPPYNRTVLFKELSHMLDSFSCHDCCTIFSIEDRKGNSPSTLTRDNPVATVTNHIVKTNFTPFWVELHFFNFIQDFLAEFRYRGKPLWYCTPDDWFFRTPVKWIWVRDFFLGKEQIAQFFDNSWYNLVIELTFKVRASIGHHNTAFVNCYSNFKAVSNTDIVVVLTKTRGCMDNTSTRVSRNVVTKDNQFIYSCIPWVFCYDVVQFLTTVSCQNLNISPAKFLRQTIQQLCSNHKLTSFTSRLDQNVINICSNCQSTRSCDGKWRSCPYNDIGIRI